MNDVDQRKRFYTAPAAMLVVGVLLAGCAGDRVQSSLHPAGPAARSVANLWWVLLAILGAYSVAVFALTLVAIFRRSADPTPPKHGGRRFILIGGILLPALILVPLLLYSVSTTASLRMRDAGLTIRVVGHRWWWAVEYPDHHIITANELVIPTGEPVRLELISADVIHSFWVPQLHGKMDLLPDKTTEFWIEADRPGEYRGQCAEYCGLQHAHMAFLVIALPPKQFVDWLSEQQSSDSPIVSPDATEPTKTEQVVEESSAVTIGELPAERFARLGERLFHQHGCAICHAIQGTPAKGWSGPDLTLLDSRRTLAGATIPNTPANLLAWLTDPQAIKPGANMPPTHASEQDLQAIVDYLLNLDPN